MKIGHESKVRLVNFLLAKKSRVRQKFCRGRLFKKIFGKQFFKDIFEHQKTSDLSEGERKLSRQVGQLFRQSSHSACLGEAFKVALFSLEESESSLADLLESFRGTITQEHLDLIKEVATPERINQASPKTGMTPLLVAAKKGDAHLAKLCLEKGAKYDYTLSDGQTVEHVAAASGSDEILDLLFKIKDFRHQRDNENLLAHFYAARENKVDTLAKLLTKRPLHQSKQLLVENCLEWGSQDCVDKLIEMAPSFNEKEQIIDLIRKQPKHANFALQMMKKYLSKELIHRYSDDINIEQIQMALDFDIPKIDQEMTLHKEIDHFFELFNYSDKGDEKFLWARAISPESKLAEGQREGESEEAFKERLAQENPKQIKKDRAQAINFFKHLQDLPLPSHVRLGYRIADPSTKEEYINSFKFLMLEMKNLERAGKWDKLKSLFSKVVASTLECSAGQTQNITAAVYEARGQKGEGFDKKLAKVIKSSVDSAKDEALKIGEDIGDRESFTDVDRHNAHRRAKFDYCLEKVLGVGCAISGFLEEGGNFEKEEVEEQRIEFFKAFTAKKLIDDVYRRQESLIGNKSDNNFNFTELYDELKELDVEDSEILDQEKAVFTPCALGKLLLKKGVIQYNPYATKEELKSYEKDLLGSLEPFDLNAFKGLVKKMPIGFIPYIQKNKKLKKVIKNYSYFLLQSNKNTELFEYLASLSVNSPKDASGNRELHLAVREGDSLKVQKLFKKGALFSLENNQGMTAVDILSDLSELTEEHSEILKILIKRGVDPNIVLSVGPNLDDTPLHFFARQGDVEAVKLCLHKGAYPFSLAGSPKEFPFNVSSKDEIKKLFDKFSPLKNYHKGGSLSELSALFVSYDDEIDLKKASRKEVTAFYKDIIGTRNFKSWVSKIKNLDAWNKPSLLPHCKEPDELRVFTQYSSDSNRYKKAFLQYIKYTYSFSDLDWDFLGYLVNHGVPISTLKKMEGFENAMNYDDKLKEYYRRLERSDP